MNKPIGPSFALNALFSFINSTLVLLFFLFVFINKSYAISVFFDTPPPPGSNSVSATFCGLPDICANSQNSGNCGYQTCPPGGNDWYKYSLTCIETDNPDPNLRYEAYYQTLEAICSIGDKCVAGEQGLRYGACDCSYSAQRYKVCCSGTSLNQCENSASLLQDNYPPPEGQCPGGAANEKFCGFGGYPSCDDPFICGAAPTPTPTPAPILNSFSINNSCPAPSATASLSWSGTPLPSSDGSCPNGFWVDISQYLNFSSYSNKCVTVTSTSAPSGFSGLTLNPGTTYYARVYNGSHSNILSTVPATSLYDNCSRSCTIGPTCNSGGSCTFNTTYTLNGQLQPNSAYQDRFTPNINNPGTFLDQNPAQGSVSWTYSPGTYTAKLDAKRLDGFAATSCQTQANITSSNWVGPSCSGSTFSGCNLLGQPTCSDWGNSGYPGWTQAQWNDCRDYCTNVKSCVPPTVSCSGSVSGSTVNWTAISNPAGTYNYAWTGTDGLSGTGNPISKTYSTTGAKTANVTATRSSDGATAQNSCSATISPGIPPPCTMAANPASGICPLNTFLSVSVDTSDMPGSKMSAWDLDGNGSFETIDTTLSHTVTYNSTTTPKFKVIDGATNADLSQTCSTTVSCGPTPPPTPPPVNCAITINGSTGTGSVSGSVGSTFTIDSSTPTLPQSIYIDGPLSSSYGPFSTSPQTVYWYTSGWPGGSYTVSNNCMSRTVNLAQSCSYSATFALSVYAFSDPVFDTNQWPQMCWWDYASSPGRLICGNRILYSQAPSQQYLAEVPQQPSSPPLLAQNKEAGLPAGGAGAVLAGESCRTSADCPQSQSGNPCANPTYCSNYYPGDAYSPEVLGTCTTSYSYGNVCGTSPNGGNMYCGGTYTLSGPGVGDGICTDTACQTNAECNDNNVCTTDTCSGYQPAGCDYGGCWSEKLGSCSYTNEPASKICQTDGSGNPLKLCSFQQVGTGSSTCSVDYIKCTDVKTVPSGTPGTPSGPCCGLTNLQVLQTCTKDPYNPNYIACYVPGYCSWAPFPVNWNYDSDHPFNNPLDNPITPLSGVRAYAVNDSCGFSFSGITDSTGIVNFYNVPRYNSGGRFNYDVWVDVPANSTFTRGIHNYLTSTWENTPLNWPPLSGGQPRFNSVNSGGRNVMLAFGFQGPPNYKISGRVMLDNNNNGCQTSTQPVSGALISVISLTFAGSPPPQITDALGNYTVQNLAADSYYTAVSNIPGRVNARRVDGGTWVSTASSTYGIPPNPPLVVPPSHTVDWCVNPISAWIQTTTGDVHSNSGLTTPGGP